jgi:chromosome partitioning protein
VGEKESQEQVHDTEIDIFGIIVSNVAYPLDNEQEAAIEWFEERFENRVPVWQIRNRVDIKRAIQSGYSIFHPDAEDIDMEDEYSQIAQEVANV